MINTSSPQLQSSHTHTQANSSNTLFNCATNQSMIIEHSSQLTRNHEIQRNSVSHQKDSNVASIEQVSATVSKQQHLVSNKEKQKLQNYDYAFHSGDKIVNPKKNIIYFLKQLLGKGVFGQVLLCQTSQGHTMAIKVIKKQPAYINQGLMEIKMLREISKIEKQTNGSKQNYLNLYDGFMWEGHLCIAMQIMDNNLLNILESSNFAGLEMGWIETWTKQLLLFLAKIHSMGIFHSDIKPQNIMFRPSKPKKPIMIDFSSSCSLKFQPFTYIQSRFYRAPQVLLGLKPYNQKMDIWSLGCLLVELYLGLPLFPGGSSYDQLHKICKLIPYQKFDPQKIKESQFGIKYFKISENQEGNPLITLLRKKQYITKNIEKIQENQDYYELQSISDIIKQRKFSKKDLQTHQLFLDLIKKMLCFNPEERITAEQAFLHPFVSGTFSELEQLRKIQDLHSTSLS